MYKLLLFSFVLTALTFTCSRVFAEEPVFFNYALPMGPINSGAVLDFSIVHAISGEFRYRFKVRPVSDLGNTEIFDAVGGTWVPEGLVWSKYPLLTPAVKLKFPTSSKPSYNLQFLLQDTVTGKVYSTPKKTGWSNLIFANYISRLNDNLNKYKDNLLK